MLETVLLVHTPASVAPLVPASNSSRGAHVKLWTLSTPGETQRVANWCLLPLYWPPTVVIDAKRTQANNLTQGKRGELLHARVKQ